ncbi:MAG: hypothetical protein HF314_03920 [Ignavibacteria bacterium]|jgi:hypothetical protein|nr:hypothetical protein [Ignavibacteria bacterium]MCU7502199.1 hypothetical protein [Ignavibacteria bacterium]MCU7517416.1 hypothetical protein [Ignavibacteria bacterium]
MIIYGDTKEKVTYTEGLKRLEALAMGFKGNGPSGHEPATELLINTGEFEAALTDFLFPECDFINNLLCIVRELSTAAGHIFIHSLNKNVPLSNRWLYTFKEVLSRLKKFNVSPSLTYSLPEGYAFYSLYPEMYLRSVEKFCREFHPTEVTVIGIRSIGTSLSALVSARMEETGPVAVHSFTVRPRGFYFDRKIVLDTFMEEELKKFNKGFYLIVDEGPGLSGTSFTSVAEKLTGLGISDEKIIFFPGHRNDGDSFVSEKARSVWKKHRQFTSEFEEVISVKNLFPGFIKEVKDVSAGMWRDVLFKNHEEFPPVYPNFEQRKYLSQDNKYLIKFAGLGRYGRDLYERGKVLWEAGFSPEVLALENGFILSRFSEEKPLAAHDVNRALLDRAASYISFLGKTFQAESGRNFNEIEEMIQVNLLKGMGEEWAERFSNISSSFKPLFSTHATAVDGRMLPCEWLYSNGAYLKTDSVQHHKDHFFPGCQDVAYDIAGFLTEFSLGKEEKQYFVKSYIKQSGDKEIEARLPFYYIFYNAFRLGMTLFSAQMSMEPEKRKFNFLSGKYSDNLKIRLINIGTGSSSPASGMGSLP